MLYLDIKGSPFAGEVVLWMLHIQSSVLWRILEHNLMAVETKLHNWFDLCLKHSLVVSEGGDCVKRKDLSRKFSLKTIRQEQARFLFSARKKSFFLA